MIIFGDVCGCVGMVGKESDHLLQLSLPRQWQEVEKELNRRLAAKEPFLTNEGKLVVVDVDPSDEAMEVLSNALKMLTAGALFIAPPRGSIHSLSTKGDAHD